MNVTVILALVGVLLVILGVLGYLWTRDFEALGISLTGCAPLMIALTRVLSDMVAIGR